MIHFSSTARNEFSPEKERESEISILNVSIFASIGNKISKFEGKLYVDQHRRKVQFSFILSRTISISKINEDNSKLLLFKLFFSQKLLNLLKFSFRRETMSFVCECKIVVQFFRVSRNIFSLFSFLFFSFYFTWSSGSRYASRYFFSYEFFSSSFFNSGKVIVDEIPSRFRHNFHAYIRLIQMHLYYDHGWQGVIRRMSRSAQVLVRLDNVEIHEKFG